LAAKFRFEQTPQLTGGQWPVWGSCAAATTGQVNGCNGPSKSILASQISDEKLQRGRRLGALSGHLLGACLTTVREKNPLGLSIAIGLSREAGF
jgi:hypothetical protein